MRMAGTSFIVIAIVLLILLGVIVLTAGIIGLVFLLNRKK